MADLRSQNKGLAGCPKRSERVAGCLACREWLVVSPTCRGGGGGWLAGLKVEGHYINSSIVHWFSFAEKLLYFSCH